jgi:hypothetical protein
MYYVGLDLHKKYVTGCVLDSQGAVAEQCTIALRRKGSSIGGHVPFWL